MMQKEWGDKRDYFAAHAPFSRGSNVSTTTVRELSIHARLYSEEMMIAMGYGPRPKEDEDAGVR